MAKQYRAAHEKLFPMPDLNDKQFWKANPNQMALPGLEEHAHPGAVHLAQGYRFRVETNTDPQNRTGFSLYAFNPQKRMAAELHWGSVRGRIGWVEAHERGKGLASALYGMGRTMASVKPQHSPVRSRSGDKWAKAVSKRYGGRVPKMEIP
jgi:hypothetical protein